jgi:hypothetical protein
MLAVAQYRQPTLPTSDDRAPSGTSGGHQAGRDLEIVNPEDDLPYLNYVELGSRLNQVHHRITAAIATAEAKLMASLSYRVAILRQSLRRQKARSIRLRPT